MANSGPDTNGMESFESCLLKFDTVFLISLLLSQVRNFSSLLLPLSGWMENMLYSVCNDLFIYINTSYLTDSYISFTLKLESRQNFCSNSLLGQVHMVKKLFVIFLHEGRWLFLLLNL